MKDYINRTSLAYILVFLSIIALSLSVFGILSSYEESGAPLPANSSQSSFETTSS